MHEMSIAIQILDTALAAAADSGAGRVTEVEIEAGAMKLIVPEALEFAWSVVIEGTLAAGAPGGSTARRWAISSAPVAARPTWRSRAATV